jgi:quercetin dioxygenase-like cupin family protein
MMDIKNLNDNIVFSSKGMNKRIVFDTPEVLCFVLSLMPGQQIPEHKHENSGMILTVLKGKGQVRVSGKLMSLYIGSIIYVQGQEDFGIPVVEEDLALLATISPNPENPAYAKEVYEQ